MVSVILPVYNGENIINRSVDSVLKQTYKDLELIIVNDGSTDNTAEVLNQIKKTDTRIKCFSKNNGGVSSARNFGINKSNGDLLFFLAPL